MGRIAEPKGVDFLIQSPPLSDKERKELSEFKKKHGKLKRKRNHFRIKENGRNKSLTPKMYKANKEEIINL